MKIRGGVTRQSRRREKVQCNHDQCRLYTRYTRSRKYDHRGKCDQFVFLTSPSPTLMPSTTSGAQCLLHMDPATSSSLSSHAGHDGHGVILLAPDCRLEGQHRLALEAGPGDGEVLLGGLFPSTSSGDGWTGFGHG